MVPEKRLYGHHYDIILIFYQISGNFQYLYWIHLECLALMKAELENKRINGCNVSRGTAMHDHSRSHIDIWIFILFIFFPMTIHAESIALHEILDRLGLQPTILELEHVKKGGSLTASIRDTQELTALGFKKLKPSNMVHLQNLGDHYWTITYPSSGQKARIRISRQNQPVIKPRIRIQLITLIQG